MESFTHTLLTSSAPGFGLLELLINLLSPIPLSMIAAFVYRKTYGKHRENMEYVHSLVLFSILIAVVMFVIGDSIARAFGLFGALTIIRFRTPVKSTIDAIFLFWSLSIGISCGAGHLLVGFGITIVCALLVFFLYSMSMGRVKKNTSILRCEINADKLEEGVENLELALTKFTKSFDLVNKILDTQSSRQTVIYRLSHNENESIFSLQKLIKEISEVEEARIFTNEAANFLEQQ